ncbi:MAG: hypothetical protein IPK77_09725 [Cellvibrio sp.]|nr:hypothetical protein [Cellvibrio sp.]
MNVRFHVEVEREARSLSRKTFRGSRKNIYEKEKHIVNSAEAIRKRWGVNPSNWKAKHLRWFLEAHLKDRSSGTRYRYYRYLREILIFMDRFDDVGPFLNGSWQFP